MCVIADGEKPVAIAGVMGGADSEVSESTKDVLIESALFQPLCIRNTARKLNLHSPSSYRFERHLNPEGVDWASLRCCELILQLAGGQLQADVAEAGTKPQTATSITLRYSRIKQVLGIDVPQSFVKQTLMALGLNVIQEANDSLQMVPPAWRPDLSREIDLIEEVGRIFGYDQIPDQVAVPMAASYRTTRHRVASKVRQVMVSCGFDEAMTPSLVPQVWSEACSPWSQQAALISNQPMLGVLEKASQNIGAVNHARRSLMPSLLEAKRINEYRANSDVELFEIAKVYLPQTDRLPEEPWMMGLVSSRSYEEVKGVIEELLRVLNPVLRLQVEACEEAILDVSRSAKLLIGNTTLGWLGMVSTHGRKLFGLRQTAVVAELNLGVLEQQAVLVPVQRAISEFPAVSRDFNFIVNESVSWATLERTVTTAAGEFCESVEYRETFRMPEKDGADRKRLLLTVQWRSRVGTLTSQQIDANAQRIIQDCGTQLSAQLVS
jgi:phenylalanyl-tRNA synthetase beta chain